MSDKAVERNLSGLDLEAAVAAVQQEVFGDWYRDPWGWPEYQFVRSDGGASVLAEAIKVTPEIVTYEVPKSNFGVRPAVIFGPAHRVAFIAAALAVARRYPNELAPWVFGWRTERKSSATRSGLADNRAEWVAYQESLRSDCVFASGVLQTDITSCFASIQIDGVLDDLMFRCGKLNALDHIETVLRAVNAHPKRSGLPQRSWASALLANWYLRPVDELLTGHKVSGHIDSCVRWMDDIWIFGREARLRSVQVELQSRLRELSLEINAGKTHMYEWSEAARVIDEQGLTARSRDTGGDSGLIGAASGAPGRPTGGVDVAEVNSLQARIFEAPELSSTSVIKHVLWSLRHIRRYQDAPRWLEIAPRVPQGADALARYFRDAVPGEEFRDWFLDYIDSEWACVPWAAAQLATALPPKNLGDAQTLMQTWATDETSPVHVAIAVARIATAAGGDGRECLRTLAVKEGSAFKRRLLCLALLQCGETRHFVRDVLASDDRNLLTIATLEFKDFRPLRLTTDFTGERREVA